MKTEDTINDFKEELFKENWESICSEDNIDKSYEISLYKFKLLHDRNCPIKKYIERKKYSDTPY